MIDYMAIHRETENRIFHEASNEFWSMMGNVELTPEIERANRNYVIDATQGLNEHHDRYLDTLSGVMIELLGKEIFS